MKLVGFTGDYNMKKIHRLIKQAKETIEYRGHVNIRFTHDKDIAIYVCPCCGAYAQLRINPNYNEIDIGGDALAVNCIGSQLSMYKERKIV